MTSIPLATLGVDTTRRDRWGRYLIVPPAGGKPVGYTRVTTIAKALDDGGGLAPWAASMTAIGMMLRPGLRARWEALIAAFGDPWYAGPTSKDLCKELVEDCKAVGGANDRREQGSSLHTITALVDVGRIPTELTPETERDVAAYIDGLTQAGISVFDAQVELTVVLDGYQVAGTFDRLVDVPGFELPLVADLKTGADLSYSWQPIAVQLAAYSRADAIYQQGDAVDGSQDNRLPMPPVDQSHGLVMWLDAGSGKLELFLVDLDAGWEAFQTSVWAREWRKTDVATRLSEYVPQDLTPLLEASLSEGQRNIADTDVPVAASQGVGVGELRAWLQDRIDEIGTRSDARADLARSWPADTPTLRGSDDHTDEQLEAIEQVLNQVEARHQIPFGATRPNAPHRRGGQVVDMFPNTKESPT